MPHALRGVSYDELERPNDSLHVQPYQRSLRTPCSLEKAQQSPQHPPYLRGSHHRRKRRSFIRLLSPRRRSRDHQFGKVGNLLRGPGLLGAPGCLTLFVLQLLCANVINGGLCAPQQNQRSDPER
ncbi:hypothetical protein NQZ68_012537 [Dissostichus eleginoides]|nr:hypothetical protein NQZ68_012537 [Dissostichus eleginoides]